MPRRKIREYQGKRLFNEHFKRFSSVLEDLPCVQITPHVDIEQLVQAHPWLSHERLVVKPDMLFGKRGMSGLVLLNATLEDAKAFTSQRMGKTVVMGGLTGVVDHFIVEPFVPHEDEYYLSILCNRDNNTVSFSARGGIHIEENWDQVKQVHVLVGQSIDDVDTSVLFNVDFPSNRRDIIVNFIKTTYKIFEDLNFHFLEMNPFTITHSGKPRPLDMRAELDDCAHFKNATKWRVDGAPVEFPDAFGKSLCEEEKYIRNLDEQTGASLKLTVLNPQGRIWGMIAGGGASVIYADTVADLGYGQELGNYGEYSGDPSEEDTFQYATKLLYLATRYPGEKRKALLIGGAIANFTDIAATFSGIIRALRNYAQLLVDSNMKIFVRRGGPNYKIALQRMRDLEAELGVPIEVYGPETNMTRIVKLAIHWISYTEGAPNDQPNGATHYISAFNGVTIHA